jgi:hypothetical protein
MALECCDDVGRTRQVAPGGRLAYASVQELCAVRSVQCAACRGWPGQRRRRRLVAPPKDRRETCAQRRLAACRQRRAGQRQSSWYEAARHNASIRRLVLSLDMVVILARRSIHAPRVRGRGCERVRERVRATNTKHIHVPDAHNIDLRLLPHTLSLCLGCWPPRLPLGSTDLLLVIPSPQPTNIIDDHRQTTPQATCNTHSPFFKSPSSSPLAKRRLIGCSALCAHRRALSRPAAPRACLFDLFAASRDKAFRAHQLFGYKIRPNPIICTPRWTATTGNCLL